MIAEYSVEEVRVGFEAWASGRGLNVTRCANGPYAFDGTEASWAVWQAAYAERIKADEGAAASIRPQRCSAHVIHPKPSPPGPGNPPLWCCLREGHDGPHRHDGGGMYPSIPFRENDEVSMIAATHPPAQAVPVDACRFPNCECPTNEHDKLCKFEATAEPVAQGDNARDLRNLIYCSLQFDHRGETDLEREELMALVRRGWLTEGEENNEFDVTDAGASIMKLVLHQPVMRAECAASKTDAVSDAIKLLRDLQSNIGPLRPDPDEEDERETWDKIDRVVERLAARPRAVPDALHELLQQMVDIHNRRGTVLTVHMNKLTEMLAAPSFPPADRVVEGMVLVPRVATDNMIQAFSDVAWITPKKLLCGFRDAYKAMLAAAPPARVSKGEVTATDFATAMRNCGLSLKTFAEVDHEARRIAKERSVPIYYCRLCGYTNPDGTDHAGCESAAELNAMLAAREAKS